MASSRRPFRERSMSLPPNKSKYIAPEAQLWERGLFCAYERVDSFRGCRALGESGPSAWSWTRIGWPRVVKLLQADMALVGDLNGPSRLLHNRTPSDITSISNTGFILPPTSLTSLSDIVPDRTNTPTDSSPPCPKSKHSNFETPSHPSSLTSPNSPSHPSTHGQKPSELLNVPRIPNPKVSEDSSGVGARDRPVFWIHLDAAHPAVIAALAGSRSMNPAVSAALRDESRLISDRMRFLLYEVRLRG